MADDAAVDTSAETAFGFGPGAVLLGQYELERRLGAGGMGEVWLARDTQLDRAVALKVLPAILASSSRAADALKSEAAQAIELGHPSIGRVYHFALHEDLPVLVMEFIRGESLAEHLDRHRTLHPTRVVEILEPLAGALDYAHARKVVHRDLKPANVLLREEDGSPVLLDFGLAAEARDQSSAKGLTGETEISGTLVYMSPEQIKGKRPRREMDLYSLAATAHEMLCGNPPFFRGDTAALYQQIIHEPFEPLERWGPEVDAVLAKGLAKEPGERHESAAAFVAALSKAAAAAPGAPLDRGATVVDADLRAEAAGTATQVVEEGPGPGATSGPAVPATAPLGAAPTDPHAATVVDAAGPPGPAAPAPRSAGLATAVLGVALGAAAVALFRTPPPAPVELESGLRITRAAAAPEAPGPGGIPIRMEPPPRAFPLAVIGRFEYEHEGYPRGMGTAVVVRAGARNILLSAYHLFGPNGGLKRQLGLHEIMGISTVRFVQGTRRRPVNSFVEIRGAHSVNQSALDPLDLVAWHFALGPEGIPLAPEAPAHGEVVHVVMHTGDAYPATIVVDPRVASRTYAFTGEAPPEGSSGAPVLNARDEVVGLHLGGFAQGGVQYGLCTRAERIQEGLQPWIDSLPKDPSGSRTRRPTKSRYEAFQ